MLKKKVQYHKWSENANQNDSEIPCHICSNQNDSEIPCHICSNVYYEKDKK